MNFQNFPASGDMLVPVQGQFIAPKGCLCVDIDFTALEIYIAAMLSNDINMINDLQAGIDFHCLRMSWVPSLGEGKTYEEIYELAVVNKNPIWAEKRKKAKAISFRKAYGGGAKKLAEKEGLPEQVVQELFDADDLNYHGLKTFNDKVFESIKNNQKLSKIEHFSVSSRKSRRFEHGLELLPVYRGENKEYMQGEYRHFGAYKSIFNRIYTFEEQGSYDRNGRLRRYYSTTKPKNYPIQGTAADVMQLATGRLLPYVLTHCDAVKMIRQIHDSNSFYILEGTEHLHIPVLCSIMSDIRKYIKEDLNIEIKLDFRVEAKTGHNFGEMKEYRI